MIALRSLRNEFGAGTEEITISLRFNWDEIYIPGSCAETQGQRNQRSDEHFETYILRLTVVILNHLPANRTLHTELESERLS